MGERRGNLSVKTEGTTLKGQMVDANSTEIFGGTVDGDQICWKVNIVDPMPMTLEFSGTVDGDKLSGSVILWGFGTSSFSGTRG